MLDANRAFFEVRGGEAEGLMPESQEGGSGQHIYARRNILGLGGWLAILGSVAAGFGACIRIAFPRVLFEPPTLFKAGDPTDYLVNQVSSKWIPSQRVWIVRERWGFFAILAVCTHLGCTPRWLASENKFKCPCHGSGYYGLDPTAPIPDNTAVNFEGPAPRPMERVKITLGDDGQIVVDKSVTFRGELGQWTKRDAYLPFPAGAAV
jgi:cytochrome b6-f complex iron-sulfur subunit